MGSKKRIIIVNDGSIGYSKLLNGIAELLREYAADEGYATKIVASLNETTITGEDLIVFITSYAAKNAIVAKQQNPTSKVFIFTGSPRFPNADEVGKTGIIIVKKTSEDMKNQFIKNILNG